MERVEIVYRPYDKYTEIAERIVEEFEVYLIQIGAINGLLGYSDELQMIIAEKLRKENDVTEKTVSEKADDGEQAG